MKSRLHFNLDTREIFEIELTNTKIAERAQEIEKSESII